MRRRTAVGCFCHHSSRMRTSWRPAFTIGSTAITMPSCKSRAAPRLTVVRQVRLVMHLGADAVSHELHVLPKNRSPRQALHRVANIPEAVTCAHLVNGAVERVASYIQQLLQLRPDFPDRNRHCRIREVPIHFHPESMETMSPSFNFRFGDGIP